MKSYIIYVTEHPVDILFGEICSSPMYFVRDILEFSIINDAVHIKRLFFVIDVKRPLSVILKSQQILT
jgi:hypothetical protein